MLDQGRLVVGVDCELVGNSAGRGSPCSTPRLRAIHCQLNIDVYWQSPLPPLLSPLGLIPCPLPSGAEVTAMKPKSIAIVGAAETTRLGVIPDMSQIQLHADAALNAMADAGLKPADI